MTYNRNKTFSFLVTHFSIGTTQWGSM